jgi:ribA/ribD-fused uncharacterized protein
MKNMLGQKVVEEFRGEHYFLSNFYPAPILIRGIGMVATVEHAFQGFKTVDEEQMKKIMFASTPAQAKQFGKVVKLRDNWQEIKVEIMYSMVKLKFQTHKDLREKLLFTGDAVLIEGNTWGDKYWGVCEGEGKNMLGIISMKVREELSGRPT